MLDNRINPSYSKLREDLLEVIPIGVKKVLDVGCNCGMLGEALKMRDKEIEVVGIEIDFKAGNIAKKKLDKVIIGNAEEINLRPDFPLQYFDCIVYGDVLEHLVDPWKVLENHLKFLTKNGYVIASIPNVRHYSVIYNLLIKGYWPYRERGIHDKTHLRFFTLKNIFKLFRFVGLNPEIKQRHYRLLEFPHKRINSFAKFFAWPFIKDFLVFQYIIVAKK